MKEPARIVAQRRAPLRRVECLAYHLGPARAMRDAAPITHPSRRPMSFDPLLADLPVAVIGAGAMGRGIAQMLAQCGCDVRLHDANAAAIDAAIASIGDALGKLVAKGKARHGKTRRHDGAAVASRCARGPRRSAVDRRGDRREAGRQAAALSSARGHRRRRRGDRVEHVVAVDHGDRRVVPPPPRASSAGTSSIRCR